MIQNNCCNFTQYKREFKKKSLHLNCFFFNLHRFFRIMYWPCLTSPGFVGKICDLIDTNSACFKNPCRNGGKCIIGNTLTNYTCKCLIGFRGECVLPPWSGHTIIWSHNHLVTQSSSYNAIALNVTSVPWMISNESLPISA